MKPQLVYDLPTRLFHWLFVFFFIFAFSIAKTVDDESPTFVFHMLAGLTLGFSVILRVIWGFIGSRNAKFSHFALKPTELISYFKGLISGDKKRWAGHNPASSWAAMLMMLLALGLGITGYLMGMGQKEAFEDIHELLANSFLILALLHVSGIALHTMRHHEFIGLSMLSGRKNNIATEEAISKHHAFIAVLMLVAVIGFNVFLSQNYNPAKGTLRLFGTTLELGEGNGEVENEGDED